MHMADALISPQWAVRCGPPPPGLPCTAPGSSSQEMDDRKLPLMGVLGAFVFASQMINFTIPANRFSGHLGGA